MLVNLRTAFIALVIVLALALAWQTWRLDRWRDQARAEKAAHAQTIANYRTGQDLARARAEVEKRKANERFAKLRKDTDDAIAKAMEDADRRTDRFIADRRVQCPAPAKGDPGRADLPRPSEPAGGADRSGADAEVVAVDAEDVRICTVNSVRLKAAREWALAIER